MSDTHICRYAVACTGLCPEAVLFGHFDLDAGYRPAMMTIGVEGCTIVDAILYSNVDNTVYFATRYPPVDSNLQWEQLV